MSRFEEISGALAILHDNMTDFHFQLVKQQVHEDGK